VSKKLFPEKKETKEKDKEDEKEKKTPKAPSIALADGTSLYVDLPGMDYSEELAKPLFQQGVTNKSMLITTNGQRTKRIFVKFG